MSRRRTATRPAGERLATVPLSDTRAAVYLRVSTEEQKDSGLGIKAQRTRCQGMALVKDWRVVGEYADEGISGTKDAADRPELARLLADAEAGQLDAVIINSLDRLGRKTRLVLDLVERLTAAGVAVVSCKESLDTTTATGKFVLTLFAALAQLERDQIAERTSAALAERGRMDGERGGRIPYGYRRVGEGRVVLDEDAARVVRLIFAQRPTASLRAIAAHLNDVGAATPQGGARWYAGTVKVILDNAAMYRGGTRGESAVTWRALLEE